jgi:transposase
MEMNIKLTETQKHIKQYICKGIKGEMTNRQVSFQLLLGVRRVQELKAKYRKIGDWAFVHGNTGRTPAIAIDPAVRNRILEIKEDERDGKKLFNNVNFTHFTEILEDFYDITISRPTVSAILKQAGYKSPKKRRTKKRRRPLYAGQKRVVRRTGTGRWDRV